VADAIACNVVAAMLAAAVVGSSSPLDDIVLVLVSSGYVLGVMSLLDAILQAPCHRLSHGQGHVCDDDGSPVVRIVYEIHVP